MRVKLTDSPISVRLPSVRPTTVSQPTSEVKAQTLSVSLSSAVRELVAAVMSELPRADAAAIRDVLTYGDQLMLAWAFEFARAEGLDLGELRKLLLELQLYRVQTAASGPRAALHTGLPSGELDETLPGVRADTAPPVAARSRSPAPAVARPLMLLLPVFTPRDEALARTILGNLAQRGALLDHGFVRALLDPDRQPSPGVDFAFLRRLVAALPRVPVAGPDEARLSLARREARQDVALALAALTLPRAALEELSVAQLRQSAGLLRAGLALLAVAPRALAPRAVASAACETERVPPVVLPAARDASSAPCDASSAASEPEPAKPDVAAVEPAAERRASSGHWRLLVQLTRNDRALLRLLYAATAARGADLRAVDDVARALVALRQAERAEVPMAAERLSPVQAEAREPAVDAGGGASGNGVLAGVQAAAREPAVDAAAPEAAQLPDVPPATSPADLVELSPSASALSYGSATQLAAKFAGTYAGLLPGPAAQLGALAASAAQRAEEPASPTPGASQSGASGVAPPCAPARPLDLSQALGLGALIGALHTQSLHARRVRPRRRRQEVVRAIAGLRRAAHDDLAEGGDLDEELRASCERSPRHRRARWPSRRGL